MDCQKQSCVDAPPKSARVLPLRFQSNYSSSQTVPIKVCQYSTNEIEVHRLRPRNIENVSPIKKPDVFPPFLETTFIASPLKKHNNPEPANLKRVHWQQNNSAVKTLDNFSEKTDAATQITVSHNHEKHFALQPKAGCSSCATLQEQLAKTQAEVVILKDLLNSNSTQLSNLKGQLYESNQQNLALQSKATQIHRELLALGKNASSSNAIEEKLDNALHLSLKFDVSSASLKSIESSVEKISAHIRRISIRQPNHGTSPAFSIPSGTSQLFQGAQNFLEVEAQRSV